MYSSTMACCGVAVVIDGWIVMCDGVCIRLVAFFQLSGFGRGLAGSQYVVDKR